jgi:hypothetical protein
VNWIGCMIGRLLAFRKTDSRISTFPDQDALERLHFKPWLSKT